MELNLKAIQNNQIEANMDSMSLQMTSIDKLNVAEIIIKSGIADLLKSLGILQKENEELEGQMKLFRINKKRALL